MAVVLAHFQCGCYATGSISECALLLRWHGRAHSSCGVHRSSVAGPGNGVLARACVVCEPCPMATVLAFRALFVTLCHWSGHAVRNSNQGLKYICVLLAGCGGGGGGPEPNPSPDPAPTTLTVDLSAYVAGSLLYVQQFSEGYIVPTAQELDQFDSLLVSFLSQQTDAAHAAAGNVNFELIRVVDIGANNNELYCLRERILRGQGFYCADFDSSMANHVSVPHPLHDRNTNAESVAVMRGTGARFLSVSTTHRCSNAATSSCSGTTSACGATGPYKVSDVAHNVNAFFHRFGMAVHDGSADAVTVQLHGCGSSTCPSNGDDKDIVARLSAGTTGNLPATELVNVLNANLNDALLPVQMGTSLSCSEATPDKVLCGTTNVLGRYINGQTDACQNYASQFSGSRWLHVEQNFNLRHDDGGGDELTPFVLIDALTESVEP